MNFSKARQYLDSIEHQFGNSRVVTREDVDRGT
jgi:hypothetical protein